MPVARIVNGSAEDAAALAVLLRELGYTVEQDSPYADLEIELQRCAREGVLKHASARAAQIGADVFLAPGALATPAGVVTPTPPTEDAAAESSLSAESVLRPFDRLQFSHSPSPESADLDGSPQIPAPMEAHQADAPVAYGSIFGGLDGRPQPQPDPETVVVQEWSVPEVQPRAGSRVLALLDAMGASIRGGVNAAGNGTANLVSQWREHRAARRELRVQRAERRRLAQQEKARLRAAPRPTVTAMVETRPLAPTARVEAISPRPVARRRIAQPSLRAGNAPLKVFAIAAGAAACVMFAWLLLSGPDSSLPPGNNNVEQQLPFGPVRITPHGQTKTAAVQPAPAAPAAYATQPAAPGAAPPATKATRPRHAARRRAAGAEDEVTVRHFDGRRSANVALSRNNPKHISDIQ